MSKELWIAICIMAVALVYLFAWALCRAAANADEIRRRG